MTNQERLTPSHWERITSPAMLQNLVNDIVFYDKQGVNVTPSSPDIGADGGWDGRFNGEYLGRQGEFCIQSKRHTGKKTAAKNSLKSDLLGTRSTRGEMEKAVANGVNHLVLATNTELDVNLIKELEELKVPDLDSLIIWDGGVLRQRLVRHPGLIHRYFGIGMISYLGIPSLYFSKHEPHIADHGIEQSLVTAQARSICACDAGLNIIYGCGGSGKTHILKAVAEQFLQDSNVIVRVISQRTAAGLESDINNNVRLAAGERLIILCDDLERQDPAMLSELAAIADSSLPIRIISTCRSTALRSCESSIGQTAPGVHVNNHEVAVLTKDQLKQLVAFTAKDQTPTDDIINLVIKQYDNNPFYLQTWAEALAKGGLSDQETLDVFNLIKRKALNEATRACTGLSSDRKLMQLLLAVAAATPFCPDNDSIINIIAELAAMDPAEVSLAIEELEGGLLRRIGSRVRFSPDTTGDLFFADGIQSSRYRKIVINKLIPINPQGVVSSLAAAQRNRSKADTESITQEIMKGWESEVLQIREYEQQTIFKQIEQLTPICPTDAINLAELHLTKGGGLGASDKDLNTNRLLAALRLVENVFLIAGLAGKERARILSLINEVNSKLEEHLQDVPAKIVEKLFRPINGEIVPMTKDLQSAAGAIEQGQPGLICMTLLVAACSEALGIDHDNSHMIGRNYTINSVPLRDNQLTRDFRSAAMLVLKNLIDNGNYDHALQIAEQHGRSTAPHGGAHISDVPLGDMIREERRNIITWLNALEIDTWSLQRLLKLEQIALDWATRKPYEDNAFTLVRKIPRSLRYRYYCRQSRMFAIDDVSTLDDAPDDERWRWLRNVVDADPYDNSTQRINADAQLASELKSQYPDVDSLADLFLEISQQLPAKDNWKQKDRVLATWVCESTDLFVQLREHAAWLTINRGARNLINWGLASAKPEMLSDLAAHVAESHTLDPEKIERFLESARALTPPVNNVRTAFERLATCEDPSVRREFIHSLWLIRGDNPQEDYNELVSMVLDTGYSSDLVKPIFYLYDAGRSNEGRIPDEIWTRIIDQLIMDSKWHDEISYIFCTTTDGSPAAFIELLKRRIEYYIEHCDRTKGKREYCVFPGPSPGWIDISKWSTDDAIKLLSMISDYFEPLKQAWQLSDILWALEARNALDDIFVSAMMELINSEIEAESSVARTLIIESGPSSFTDDQLLNICQNLITRGQTELAHRWVCNRSYNGSRWSQIGEDGVSNDLNEAIVRLESILKTEFDSNIRPLLERSLKALVDVRSQTRKQHEDSDDAY